MKFLLPLLLSATFALASNESALQSAIDNAGDAMAVEGHEGWRFLTKELRHLLAEKPGADSDVVEAITDFAEQLAALNVRLLVVPVPPKAAVEALHLGGSQPEPAAASNPDAPTIQALQARGVEVLDLWPAFIDASQSGPVYLARDSHWNPRGIAIAAKLIADALRDTVPPTTKFPVREEVVKIQGDLGGELEDVTLQFVEPGGQGQRMEPDRESPVLLFGDSHVLVFHDGGDMHAASAGLPEQVALALQYPVDVLAVRGSGATAARVSLARRVRSNPGWLKDKKAVVWCLGAREFTQADTWKKIPLLPK